MRLEISHRTRYAFDRPARLTPHTLRFRPRDDGAQRVLAFDLRVAPAAATAEVLDAAGTATRAWFDAPTDALEVVARSEVETLREDPFRYVLEPYAVRVPFAYEPPLARELAPFLAPASPAARALAEEARSGAEGTVAFLSALADLVRARCRQVRRETGPPLPAAETLARGEGACRDLAVVFAEAARAAGLAARFVSGYALSGASSEGRDLHAWTEVFLPGGGWRGYDPSEGLAVADRHVAVAAAADPALSAPVTGGLSEAGVQTRLEVEVSVRQRGSTTSRPPS